MKVLNLQIQRNCQDCGIREVGFFCDLPESDLKEFESIKITKAYPKGTKLFVEGQRADGVYLLCQGRVKISTCSPEGKIIILDIAEPGQLLGLSSAMNGVDHEISAEALEMCQVDYVPIGALMDLFQNNSKACLSAAKQLSRDYHAAFKQVCALGLADSVADKLARLFLGWTGNGRGSNGSVHITNSFTHGEIAEMIGTSRETVTRALKQFRESNIVTLKGSDLIIHDRKRLKSMIGTRRAFQSRL